MFPLHSATYQSLQSTDTLIKLVYTSLSDFCCKKIRQALLGCYLSPIPLIKVDMLSVISAMLKECSAKKTFTTYNSFWQVIVLKTQTGKQLRQQDSLSLCLATWQFIAQRIISDL